jgi:hypothetical protein
LKQSFFRKFPLAATAAGGAAVCAAISRIIRFSQKQERKQAARALDDDVRGSLYRDHFLRQCVPS